MRTVTFFVFAIFAGALALAMIDSPKALAIFGAIYCAGMLLGTASLICKISEKAKRPQLVA